MNGEQRSQDKLVVLLLGAMLAVGAANLVVTWWTIREVAFVRAVNDQHIETLLAWQNDVKKTDAVNATIHDEMLGALRALNTDLHDLRVRLKEVERKRLTQSIQGGRKRKKN